jgi:hypothetical protein
MREIEDDDEGRGRRRLPVGRLPYGFLPQGGFFSRIGNSTPTPTTDSGHSADCCRAHGSSVEVVNS